MKKLLLFCLFALSALSYAQSSDGPQLRSDQKGAFLIKTCRASIKLIDAPKTADNDDVVDSNYCLGYFGGFTALLDRKASHVCLPSNTELGTLIRIYLKFADDHPVLYQTEKGLGVYGTFLSNFPCSAANP